MPQTPPIRRHTSACATAKKATVAHAISPLCAGVGPACDPGSLASPCPAPLGRARACRARVRSGANPARARRSLIPAITSATAHPLEQAAIAPHPDDRLLAVASAPLYRDCELASPHFSGTCCGRTRLAEKWRQLIVRTSEKNYTMSLKMPITATR